MVLGLEAIINDFSQELKEQYPDYLALYSYFIDYVEDKYPNDYLLDDFLNHDFTKRDIIDSCIWYINHSSKVTKNTAITKYLNSMTKLYESCFQKHGFNNRNLFAILPFASLSDEVKRQLNYRNLGEQNPIKAIDINVVNCILDYFSSYKRKKNVSFYQNSIAIKLILLYGFKMERIKYFLTSDILLNEHKLLIKSNSPIGEICIKLELPSPLVFELKYYMENYFDNYQDEQYLFLSSNKKVFSSSFANITFRNIQKNYPDVMDTQRITLTGIAKYAIVNMISSGISKANIKLITGMEDVIIDDCEQHYLKKNFYDSNSILTLNREINKTIRGIDTYDKV